MPGIGLRHFRKDEIRITPAQAERVLRFFFPDQPMTSVSDDDVEFAQALLVEAIDASSELGYVEILADKTLRPLADLGLIKDLAKAFCKQALKTWFRHATGKDFTDPQIYEIVRRTISRNWRSVWSIRVATGELTGY
jgi:hypothetical protein